MKHLITFAGVVLLAFTALHLRAGTDDNPVIILEESVITATRTDSDLLDAPAHVTVITQADIERLGVKNVADLLAVQAGVTVRSYGPEGALSNLSIRGSRSEGVLVLIDGIRMNDSRAGSIDLSLIPLHSVEKIEIVRGGTSALYGADAIGGVVNIITRKEADGRLAVAFENGSYIPRDAVQVSEGDAREQVSAHYGDLLDTQKVTIGYSRLIGGVDFVTSGSFLRANNGYTWNDEEYVDDYRRRVNAEALGGDLYASLSFPAGEGRLAFTGQGGYSTKGAPGPIDPASFELSTDASQTDARAMASFHYGTKRFFSDALTLDVKGSYTYSSIAFENPDPVYPVDDSHTTHALALEATQEMLSFESLSLIYGLNLSHDFAVSTQIGDKSRTSGGLFLESPLYLSSRLTITPVLRYDFYTDFPDTLNFKLSGVYALSSSTSLKASAAKSYRAPTLNDIFWPDDGWVSGNPDLKPETGYSFEVGISNIHPSRSVDLFIFARYMIDEIIWGPEGAIYKPNNIGKSFYPGIELAARFRLARSLWFDSSASFIYSYVFEDPLGEYSIGEDRRAPNVPVLSIDGGIEYTGDRDLLSLSAVYRGGHYVYNYFTGVTTNVDDSIVLNANYKRVLRGGVSLTLAVDNILNARYETAAGYIMPPLFIRTGVEAVF
jgi:outer membrane cobalamin receptor